MPDLIPVLEKNDIDQAVAKLAARISSDYRDGDLVAVAVLKGAFVFLADLVRKLTIPVTIDFVRLASYGSQTATSGNIRLTKDIEIDIRDKDVLIVEDIVDTGLSLTFLVDHLNGFQPRSVRICALVDKRERRQQHLTVDYVGSVVDQGFLVGYGLDFAERYRHLPGIYHLKQ